MGDPRGFLKIKRAKPAERPVAERLQDWREIVVEPAEEGIRGQASRCMDCGIPFCHQGCPLGNVIPEFNDYVHRGRMSDAIRVLYSTNNFPEITGRVCPAPCEASCVLGLENAPVTIKDVERSIANASDFAPQAPMHRTGKRIAVIGSGPAGMAAAQQLARAGHTVVLFEKDDRLGGLLRYGIPDFKLEKGILDRRLEQMRVEGVEFRVSANVTPADLAAFDATILATGSRIPRDLPVPGRDLEGVYYAMDFLTRQNAKVAGDSVEVIHAEGKSVVVIGGGDTGSDCVGTSNRHGAKSVMQLELMPKPPLARMPENPWPAWPLVMRTSSSHEEGCEREFAIMTKAFVGTGGRLTGITAVRAELTGGKIVEVEGSETTIPCDLALLAMGFVGPDRKGLVEELGLALDANGNVISTAAGATNVPKIFAAGDASRGQSLVVWAIADGRRVAAGVDAFLRTRAAA